MKNVGLAEAIIKYTRFVAARIAVGSRHRIRRGIATYQQLCRSTHCGRAMMSPNAVILPYLHCDVTREPFASA